MPHQGCQTLGAHHLVLGDHPVKVVGQRAHQEHVVTLVVEPQQAKVQVGRFHVVQGHQAKTLAHQLQHRWEYYYQRVSWKL